MLKRYILDIKSTYRACDLKTLQKHFPLNIIIFICALTLVKSLLSILKGASDIINFLSFVILFVLGFAFVNKRKIQDFKFDSVNRFLYCTPNSIPRIYFPILFGYQLEGILYFFLYIFSDILSEIFIGFAYPKYILVICIKCVLFLSGQTLAITVACIAKSIKLRSLFLKILYKALYTFVIYGIFSLGFGNQNIDLSYVTNFSFELIILYKILLYAIILYSLLFVLKAFVIKMFISLNKNNNQHIESKVKMFLLKYSSNFITRHDISLILNDDDNRTSLYEKYLSTIISYLVLIFLIRYRNISDRFSFCIITLFLLTYIVTMIFYFESVSMIGRDKSLIYIYALNSSYSVIDIIKNRFISVLKLILFGSLPLVLLTLFIENNLYHILAMIIYIVGILSVSSCAYLLIYSYKNSFFHSDDKRIVSGITTYIFVYIYHIYLLGFALVATYFLFKNPLYILLFAVLYFSISLLNTFLIYLFYKHRERFYYGEFYDVIC